VLKRLFCVRNQLRKARRATADIYELTWTANHDEVQP
jgi:hypothetical protein